MNHFLFKLLKRVALGFALLGTALDATAANLKPGLTDLHPRGAQRGQSVQIKLTGTNLIALTKIRFADTNLTGTITASATNQAEFELRTSDKLARGPYEFSVVSTNGESGNLTLHVDDLPQVVAPESNPMARAAQAPVVLSSLPISVWAALEKPADIDLFEFEARAGQTLVLDLAAKSVGSKIASGELMLLDADGTVLAQNNGFDGGDPLLSFQPAHTGRYRVRVSDRMAAGSKDHFYRLTIGALPFVTAVYPLGVPAFATSAVHLVGFNVSDTVPVKAGPQGETDVPIDKGMFRSRRSFKVMASAAAESLEAEPNDSISNANELSVPGAVNGRFFSEAGDTRAEADHFRFRATAGRTLILETQAAQRKSPADTKLEILSADGQPVPRLKLQALRDSFVTFRGIDSVQQGARLENWEEMELNNYIYLNGDVARLFRMPQGPDSDLLFYLSAGKRRSYFDGTPTGHALEEPCYVVEPRRLDEPLVGNGLPVFTIHYANDDDGERKLGTDSKVYFTPSADGLFIVRVSDSRGFTGDRFAYRLVIRDAKPDFTVTVAGANPSVPRGSAQSFSVNVDRIDGFEGEVRVEITNVPPGFIISTPLVVEAGHSEAKGTVFAATNAVTTTNADILITATAVLDGKAAAKTVNSLGQIKVIDAPKLFVSFEPYTNPTGTNIVAPPEDRPFEITIAPGQTVPAWLKIQRNGHKELVTFQVENLPHGVIVDNIGLNGVLIPKEDNDRQIFLTCARWVTDQDRLCYAIEQNAGRQTSRPLLLRVRRSASTAGR